MRLVKVFPSRNDYAFLFIIWSVCFLFDAYWLHENKLPPAWDQSTHLSRAYQISYLFDSFNLFDSLWWNELWSKAPSYRGPFTYLLTVPIFKLWNLSYKSATLVNQFYNALLLFSTYCLGRFIHSRQAGLWAAFLCAISPVFIEQRIDYLIDFPLTALITACWLSLSFERWNVDINKWKVSFLLGCLLGFVFLTRPTGLIFLWLPFLYVTLISIFNIFKGRFDEFFQLIFSLSVSFLIAFPWFSQNWLTIITSINKAREWGILYQDGLEANTLEAWFFYPLKIPGSIGSFLFGFIFVGIFIDLLYRRKIKKRVIDNPLKGIMLTWWLSFPLGGLIICILMSSKDIRFFLPLLPQVFIFLGIIISSIERKWSKAWKISLVIVGSAAVLWNQFGIGINLTGKEPHPPNSIDEWPLPEIVKYIREASPNKLSNLAVLPDTKYLNAFNIDAEGKRQNNLVSARQTVSKLEFVHQELSNFDWFLIKTGNQGIMANERQLKLERLLKRSPYFTKAKKWNLPDGTEASLFRRISPSFEINEIQCTSALPNSTIKSIEGGLEISVSAAANQLIGSQLLVELENTNSNLRFDQSIAQGMLRIREKNKNKCFIGTQRLSIKSLPEFADELYSPSLRLLNKNSAIIKLPLLNASLISLNPSQSDEGVIANNKVQILLDMASQLREGELNSLFDKVGQINQSDPEQIYLEDSESILNARLTKEPNNLSYLYALGLSQALQRKAELANQTFNRITILDDKNEYAFLAKSIIETYQFKFKEAQRSITTAEYYNSNDDIKDIIKIIKRIFNVLNLEFI